MQPAGQPAANGKKYGRSPDYDYLMTKWFPDAPFDIVWTQERGRFMVAKSDMKAGDHVVRSFPYCYAVCDEVKEYCCQYCFNEKAREREALPFPCTKCNQIWYCSEDCKRLDAAQHSLECRVMEQFFKNVFWDDPGNRTEVKLLCRTLSRRTMERKHIKPPPKHFFHTEPLQFEDYFRLISSRKNYGDSLLDSLKGIVEYVKSLDDEWLRDITEEQLLDVVLKTRNNMFNVFKSSSISLGWGVYVEASLFNHSCQPNVCLFRKAGTPEFQFVAIHDIPAGGELTVTYLGYGDLGTRRAHLLEHYFFRCDCVRCSEEETGSTVGYNKWYTNSHCKRAGCLGYLVPLPTQDDPTKIQPFCNYCSFSDDDQYENEEEDAADEKPKETTTAAPASSAAAPTANPSLPK